MKQDEEETLLTFCENKYVNVCSKQLFYYTVSVLNICTLNVFPVPCDIIFLFPGL